MIKIGDRIPDATLTESTEFGEACPLAPAKISVAEATKGKRIVLFGLPGAYTPTCSAQHVPGYVAALAELKAKGIDTIACVSVNDAFVMGAWGEQQKASDKVMMLADGNGDFTRALGLELDATKFGMGKRSQRFSMVVDNGVVTQLNVEAPGAFEVSSADHMMALL